MMTFLRQRVFFIIITIFTLSFSGLLAAHTLSPPSPHKHNEFLPGVIFLLFGDDGVVDDSVNVAIGQIDNSLNVLSNDNNLPSSTLVSFGGPAESNVSDQAIGSTLTATSGAQISLAANGILTYDATSVAATTTGIDTVFYAVNNSGAIENGEITIRYGEAPTALDGPDFNSLFSDTLTVTSVTGLLSNDALGTPAATFVGFGGGDLGGSVTDNMPGESVSVANGTLTVNADGSFTLANPPLTDGVITFSYRIQNNFGFSDAVEEITITAPPTAQDDALTSKVNINNAFPANTLFNDNGNGMDDFGTPTANNPAASIISFGNFNGVSGNATEFVFGTTQTIPAPINGDLTVNADGSLTVNNPTADGTFTFQYTLDNGVGSGSVATITVNVVSAPIAQNNTYTFLRTADQTISAANGLFVDSSNGNDFLGSPTSTLTSFGGGDLGGTITDNAANNSVASTALGGTLTVNNDGSFSLSGQPFNTGTYTFDYRLSNIHGTSDGTVTFIVQNTPIANDDDFTFDIGANQISPNSLFVDNGNNVDNLGIPAATITNFGGGSLGGTVTDNAATASVALAGGTLTVNANGSWALTGQPFTPGSYTFNYRLSNAAGTADATVTLNITQQPSANSDSYALQALIDSTFNAASGVFIDNGNGADTLGSPTGTLTSFGGGDLGGTVTDNTAGSSVAFAAAGGNLTVNADGGFSLTGQPFNEGTFTFDYRLTNSAGTSDGSVILIISNLPATQDDDFSFPFTANQTAPNGLFLDNGNGADTVSGATITSFGGGSLGGAVTDNAGGASVSLAGGTLTINTNGTWSLSGQPFTGGVFTVDYRLTNAGGTSDATITFDITAPPVANNDNPAMNSAPGGNFHGALNTANNVANGDGDDLDQNDNIGNPVGAIDFFGAIQFNNGLGLLGSANGAVTDNAAGSTLNFSSLGILGITDGSLTVNANGSYTLAPPTNYTGALGFQYRLTNTAGSDTATVILATGVRPQCVADAAYTSSINIPISVADGVNDVLANDIGNSLSIFTVQGSAANVGNTIAGNTSGSSSSNNQVQLNANGSFNHSPAAGVAGANTFSYTVANGFGTAAAPCTVTVTTSLVSGNAAWFIDQSATSSDNVGTFDDPFTSIASFNTQNASGTNQPTINDRIYIDPDGSYNEADGINLLNGQNLSGGTVQFDSVYTATAGGGAALGSNYSTFAGTAEGTRTAIATTAGDGIDLADTNTVNGFNIGDTPTGFGLDGTAVGSPTINNVDISGSGGALRIGTSGNMTNVSLGQVSSSSSVAENIRLIGTTGTLTFGSGGSGLSGSASGSNAVIVSGGSVNFTYADPISKINAGRVASIESMTGGTKTLSGMLSSSGTATGILVQNNSAGTTNFSGAVKTINTGGNDAVTLQNNAGSTANFSSGGLDIDTTTGRGFLAVNSGTVTISGANNTVTTGTGTPVDIANTTIGATGVTFLSINSNGSSNGIALNNTGTIGSFNATGTGTTAGSGGTIQNTTGSGVLLTNAHNLSLANININNTGLHGIQGTTVSNLDLSNSNFTAIGSTTAHHGLFINNLSGTGLNESVFDDVNFSNIAGRGVYINNTTSQGQLVIQGNSSFTGIGLQGALLETNGATASLTSTIGNTSTVASGETVTFSGIGAVGIATNANTGTQTTTVRNSLFNAGSSDMPIAIEGSSSGITGNSGLTATITGNDITIPNGAGTGRRGITFNAGSATGVGSANGTISSNIINSPEVAVTAINVSNTGNSTATNNSWDISNNTISLTASGVATTTQGIFVEANSSTASAGISAAITNNNVVANGGSGFTTGIGVVAGNANNANQGNVCTSISGNTASAPNASLDGNVPVGSADMVILSFASNTISLVGLPLGNTTATAVDTQATANNTADTFVFPNAASSYMGVASCP